MAMTSSRVPVKLPLLLSLICLTLLQVGLWNFFVFLFKTYVTEIGSDVVTGAIVVVTGAAVVVLRAAVVISGVMAVASGVTVVVSGAIVVVSCAKTEVFGAIVV